MNLFSSHPDPSKCPGEKEHKKHEAESDEFQRNSSGPASFFASVTLTSIPFPSPPKLLLQSRKRPGKQEKGFQGVEGRRIGDGAGRESCCDCLQTAVKIFQFLAFSKANITYDIPCHLAAEFFCHWGGKRWGKSPACSKKAGAHDRKSACRPFLVP